MTGEQVEAFCRSAILRGGLGLYDLYAEADKDTMTLRDGVTGQEFLIEVRAMPMGG